MQIDGLVNIQALMISYLNDFKLMMIVTLCAIPLVFLLRKPAHAPAGAEAGRRGYGIGQRRASVAILSASPTSTVPISQRCTSSQSGRPARKAAIEPAVTAMSALTVTLIVT